MMPAAGDEDHRTLIVGLFFLRERERERKGTGEAFVVEVIR